MADAVQPVAVARISLSDDDRKRIAEELGLSDDEYEAVPDHLSIARYKNEDIGGDVGSFLAKQAGDANVDEELALSPTTSFTTIGTTSFSAARLRSDLLIPV